MHGISRRAFAAGALVAAGGLLSMRASAAVPAPSGKALLKVSGLIGPGNVGDTVQFDLASLEALGTVKFKTATPWFTGVVEFEGVPMTKLLEAVGSKGTTITALALNDYSTNIPISDFAEHGAILATKRDGAYMPVRDKGPLFIVYPYDSKPELKAQQYYSRSAWAVAQIIVK